MSENLVKNGSKIGFSERNGSCIGMATGVSLCMIKSARNFFQAFRNFPCMVYELFIACFCKLQQWLH